MLVFIIKPIRCMLWICTYVFYHTITPDPSKRQEFKYQNYWSMKSIQNGNQSMYEAVREQFWSSKCATYKYNCQKHKDIGKRRSCQIADKYEEIESRKA